MSVDRDYRVRIETQAEVSDLDRYNAKLKEMADRTAAASRAAKDAAEEQARAERILKAKTAAAERAAAAEKEAARANTDLAKSYKSLSQADVDAALKGTEATTKWTASKRQLREAVRGLSTQFPILGRVAALAINPITIAVAGLSAAFVVAKDKFASAGQVLKSSGFSADQMNATAEAWKKFSDQIKATSTGASELAASLDRIQSSFDVIQKLGRADNPIAAKAKARRQAAAKIGAGASALRRADAVRRDAERIKLGGSDEEDASVLESLLAEAESARGELSGVEELIRIGELLESKGNLRDVVGAIPEGTRWLREFGLARPNRILPDLYRQRREYQAIVDRPSEYRKTMQSNAARRAAYSNLLDEESRLRAFGSQSINEGRRLSADADVDFAVQNYLAGRPLVTTPTGAGWSNTPQAVDAVRRAVIQANEFEATMTKFIDVFDRITKLLRQHADTKPE